MNEEDASKNGMQDSCFFGRREENISIQCKEKEKGRRNLIAGTTTTNCWTFFHSCALKHGTAKVP